MKTSARRIIFLLAWVAATGGAVAQDPVDERAESPPRVFLDAGLLYAAPVGEFSDYVERGFGAGIGVIVPVGENSPWSLRVDGTVLNYGHESREVCPSTTIGCRVRLDLTTTNNVLLLAAGPQLALPRGPVRPYVQAFLGGALFSTSSSLSGVHDDVATAQTVNHHDLTWSWGGGGGLRVALPVTDHRVLMDLGARYHQNGRVDYLREGDITDLPDGSIALDPQRSRADMLTFRIGITFAPPTGRGGSTR